MFLYSGGLCKAGVLCPPISMDTARTRSLWRWEKKILAIPDNMVYTVNFFCIIHFCICYSVCQILKLTENLKQNAILNLNSTNIV